MNNNILSRMAFSLIQSKKAALLLVWGLITLVAGSAQAAVYTWTGADSGDWADADNWITDSVLYATPRLAAAVGADVGDESAVVITNSVNLDQFTRYSPTTIKSLTFGTDSDGAYALGLRANTGADRDLTFSAGSGANATLTVSSGSTGDKTFGRYEGSLTLGEVVLESNLDITHNGSGSLIFDCEIRGVGDISLSGTGLTVFSGINTYSGNTTADGALTLSEAAQLAFTIGTNGVNNALSGSGSVTLDGDFLLDLAGAGRTVGDSWQLVDVDTLTETFGPTFSLASTVGSFMETNGVWSISENGTGFEFAENTGLLTVVSSMTMGEWMSGKMGVGWRFRADSKSEIANWNVATLVTQVKSIPGLDYVVFNLSDAAHGDAYIAPHSVLTAITPSATPNDDRDLFLEMATAFQAEGIKVMAYVASQGPAMLKHGAEAAFDSVEVSPGVFTSQAMDNWSNYVYSVYNVADFSDEREMYKRAFGEVILDEYAARYGTLIDGWWFDNGYVENFDAELVYSIAKKYNPNCAVGTSSDLTFNTDFVNGHPAVMAVSPASGLTNLPMLTKIEVTPDGYLYKDTHPILGHMFMPLGELWNSGAIVWELDHAADWMTRCLNAGGAWTWNVDLTDADSMIRADSVAFLADLAVEKDAMIASNLSAPAFSQATYDGGAAQFGVAYTGSCAGWATDADGDTVTYAIAPGGPDWLVVSTNGSLSGTPYTTFDLGTNRFTLVAADGKGRIDLAELEIYVTDEFGSGIPHSHVSFDNLRGNLSAGTIDGLDASDPSVTITKATNGNDVVLSLSIINQNFDGGDVLDDSLTWDIRVKGFSGGMVNEDGTNSSVTLGTNVFVGTTDNEFGVSGNDLRFVNPGESIQFSVENVSLTAEPNATVQFDGFDGIWGTGGTYILGTGSGLESMIIASNMNVSLPSPTVLTLAATANERLRDLDGGFTIYPEGLTPSTSYATWIAGFGLSGDDLLEVTDVEPDGLNNLQEYALGGNPTNDDAAVVLPDGFVAQDAGTDYLYYVHNERTDDSALVYTVGTKTNLVTDIVLNTNDVSYVNESGEVDSIKSVTNRTAVTEGAKFIQLEVQQN